MDAHAGDTLNLNAPVSAALARMREHNLQHLPIVLDTGELRGMITQGDIRGAEILVVSLNIRDGQVEMIRHMPHYNAITDYNRRHLAPSIGHFPSLIPGFLW